MTAGFRDFNCCNYHDRINHNSTFDKKLLVICHSYNNFQKDSIEGLSGYFKEINVHVRTNPFTEISNFLPVPQLERFKRSYKIDLLRTPSNINVIPTPLWYLPGDRSYKLLGETHFNAIEKVIQHYHQHFNLILSHFTWSAGYAGARLKEKYSVPFIVTAHGYDIYSLPFKDDEWKKKIEYVLNTADHIITVSQSNRACIKKLDVSRPVTVIPNGFRSDLFYPRDSNECRKMLNLPLDKKIILTVGNLDPVKGQTHLVESVKKIIRERKDILCVIVGYGKLHTALERLIRSLALEDYVMLAGGKPHDEIPLWMNACDIFVLPSLRESFGVVQIEALACGKPIVATRNGGSEEVITSDEYGVLVEPADSGDLAEKILMALEREWDRAAILRYAERFKWEDISKEILAVYQEVGV
jgi:glycosyltransferase involved in cell wall biosynthesis